MKLTAEHVIFTWAQVHAAHTTNLYRRRADGKTAYESCFGHGYNGEILPFGETALFKVPMSHARELAAGVLAPKGDTTMVKGIWVGKHPASDDHCYLTSSGWHRARTARRLEPLRRAEGDLFKSVKGVPWDVPSAVPTGSGARHRPPQQIQVVVPPELGQAAPIAPGDLPAPAAPPVA
ncbi:MAG TPA: hypothetical protein EYQ31_08310, partial [Candidatus Handelsmanbacteria bacterium]|nr:hypothetical protein [Candidatus Handelsmanbacteria bacterium]